MFAVSIVSNLQSIIHLTTARVIFWGITAAIISWRSIFQRMDYCPESLSCRLRHRILWYLLCFLISSTVSPTTVLFSSNIQNYFVSPSQNLTFPGHYITHLFLPCCIIIVWATREYPVNISWMTNLLTAQFEYSYVPGTICASHRVFHFIIISSCHCQFWYSHLSD